MLELSKYYVIVDTDGTKFDLGDIVYIHDKVCVNGTDMWRARKFRDTLIQLIEEYNVLRLSDDMQIVINPVY